MFLLKKEHFKLYNIANENLRDIYIYKYLTKKIAKKPENHFVIPKQYVQIFTNLSKTVPFNSKQDTGLCCHIQHDRRHHNCYRQQEPADCTCKS